MDQRHVSGSEQQTHVLGAQDKGAHGQITDLHANRVEVALLS